MKNTSILVVTGSVRPNNVNEKIVLLVREQLNKKGANVIIANLGELGLPFFDSPYAPTNPAFAPSDERVQKWTAMVDTADGVVFVTPEYNHTMSPVQLNAIDWIGKEWIDKHIALIGYGWTSGGGKAHDTAREALAANLKANVGEKQTNLFFTKDISPDGTVIDEAGVTSKISETLNELIAAIK